jgi:hypothetical protein
MQFAQTFQYVLKSDSFHSVTFTSWGASAIRTNLPPPLLMIYPTLVSSLERKKVGLFDSQVYEHDKILDDQTQKSFLFFELFSSELSKNSPFCVASQDFLMETWLEKVITD